MKKVFVLGITAVMIFGVFVLSSCFTPAPTVKLGTALYDAISSWSTDVSIKATGVVIGYPERIVNGKTQGGFYSKLYIEDEKGGVYVYNSDLNERYDSAPSSYKFNIGDVVTVSGTLTEYTDHYCDDFEIVIAATSSIVKTGKTVEVVPDDLTTSDATLTGHHMRLVKVSGTATAVGNASFLVKTTNMGTVTIYDKVYDKHNGGGGLNFSTNVTNGDKVEVTGIVIIYRGNYEILPRTVNDVVKK